MSWVTIKSAFWDFPLPFFFALEVPFFGAALFADALAVDFGALLFFAGAAFVVIWAAVAFFVVFFVADALVLLDVAMTILHQRVYLLPGSVYNHFNNGQAHLHIFPDFFYFLQLY
ncbi:MAG: hypothetical protein JXR45_17180 [Deltaproteobacteria bacterium]|nr:hypothetical protein [Deltaproteobacteria bacterium]